MTEAQLDALAWDTVRELRNTFVGRSRSLTDEDWHDAILSALLRVSHDAGDLDEQWQNGMENGYNDGYDDAVEGRPNRYAETSA